MGKGSLGADWHAPPGLAAWQRQAVSDLRRRMPRDPDVVWFFSSGTGAVNRIKCIGLSRSALENSARAVNAHLRATARDRWLLAIPSYHVGGFAVGLRAQLSKSGVSNLGKWSARRFVAACERSGATLSSLVPTQVYDLAASGLRAPKCVRAVVVGGGALGEDLYARGRALGWPLLPSYGLTETASQVATAPLSSLKRMAFPALEALGHARLELRDGRIWVQATSLCQWIAEATREGQVSLENPLRNGWLRTDDVGERRPGGWRILGRVDEVVKILGVLVSLPQVESDLRELFQARGWSGDVAVVARPAEREGHALIMVTDTASSLNAVMSGVQAAAPRRSGPERLKHLAWVEVLPRATLGKIHKAELMRRLGLTSESP